MVPIVRVGQHAGNKLVYSGEPLDDFEPVCLVDGEAHSVQSHGKSNPVKGKGNCASCNSIIVFQA